MTPQESSKILFQAAFHADLDAAKQAVEAGGDVNIKDIWGQTPLHVVAISGHIGIARLLIERGADLNPVDKWNQTPLRLAMAMDHKEMSELLRQYGNQARQAARER